jgi:hypothetical protein
MMQTENTLLCYINWVKIDFIAYPYQSLYPIQTIQWIRLASIPDIITMKLNAVSTRWSKKDFRDIASLLPQYNLATMIEYFTSRHPKVNLLHIIRSLYYYDDADQELDPHSLTTHTRSDIKQIIKTHVTSYTTEQLNS